MKGIGTGSVIALALIILAAGVTQHNAISALAPDKSAADFVVTSAHDAGPGSLRDAILAADRMSSRAHIIISVPRITLDSTLPALINPHGVDLEARPDAGSIDADRQAKGAVLQVNSPASILRGLRVLNSHDMGILVNAAGVRLESLTVTGAKTGILVAAAATGCVLNNVTLENNDTGVTADPGIHDVSVLSSIFRGNTRAGFWLVGAEAQPDAPVREQARIIDSVFEKNADGVVLANHATLIQKSRFIGTRDTALLILGGEAHVEDSEFRDSLGTALSVSSGRHVVVAHSRFTDNASNAILTRDSDITIEHNTLLHNGSGVVAVQTLESVAVIRDNTVSRTNADAITVIGGEPLMQRNQVFDNHGAGMRVLDLQASRGGRKATPHLDGNVLKGNGIDLPPLGVYKLADAR